MAVVAALNVLLTANAAQFTSTINNSIGTLRQLNQAAASVASVMKNVIPVAIATAATGGFALMIKHARDTVSAFDHADKSAGRLGMSYSSLATLQQAAVLNGSSIEVMDSALAKMTATLGKAQLGEKGATESLQQLGLAFSDLQNLAPEQQFALLMERIDGLGNPMLRAVALQDIFGRGAGELGNLIGMNAAKMAELQAELEQSGVVFSPVQQAMMRAAAASVDQLSTAWTGLANQLGVTVLPVFNSLVSMLTKVIEITNRAVMGINEMMRDLARRFGGPLGMLGMAAPPTAAAAAPAQQAPIPVATPWKYQSPRSISAGSQSDLQESFFNQLRQAGIKNPNDQAALIKQGNALLARIERHLAEPQPVFNI